MSPREGVGGGELMVTSFESIVILHKKKDGNLEDAQLLKSGWWFGSTALV